MRSQNENNSTPSRNHNNLGTVVTLAINVTMKSVVTSATVKTIVQTVTTIKIRKIKLGMQVSTVKLINKIL